jgi:hypothetical protein
MNDEATGTAKYEEALNRLQGSLDSIFEKLDSVAQSPPSFKIGYGADAEVAPATSELISSIFNPSN